MGNINIGEEYLVEKIVDMTECYLVVLTDVYGCPHSEEFPRDISLREGTTVRYDGDCCFTVTAA